MGDPAKPKKKYKRPFIIWEKERIDEEKELTKEYGLKNKKEIWKARSILGNFKDQAKKLVTLNTEQSKKEEEQLMNRLISYGLINSGDPMDKILGLGLKNILERRLQTVVFRLALANTVNQARQFIVHEHILIDNKKITGPSYLVLKKEESKIKFSDSSKLADEEHPERNKANKLTAEEELILKKKKSKTEDKEEESKENSSKEEAKSEENKEEDKKEETPKKEKKEKQEKKKEKKEKDKKEETPKKEKKEKQEAKSKE